MKSLFFLFINLCLFLHTATAQLSGIKICIDPGHGGYDPANDRKIELPYGIIFWESEGNLMTANHTMDLLTQLGASVKLTRTENTDASDISLSARSTIANEFGADFFLSNHTNAGGGGNNYSLVLFKGEDNSPAWPQAKVMGSYLAPDLQDMLRTTNYHNRGDLSFLGFNLGVIKNTNMPAVLSEGSFHDLNEEAFRLKNSEYSRNYAWSIARSMCKYFNVDGFQTGRTGGIVTDRTTGQVLNNIHVVLNPGDKHYYGDEFYNGFYAFGDISPGNYQLTVSRTGYIPVTISVNIESNKYTENDISLPPDNNGTPFADFDIIGLPAGAGDELTFNASKSADNGTILKYLWNFGDGSNTDTGLIVKHIFIKDSTFNVSLTVTDNEQNTSSITKSVLVKTLPPLTPAILSAVYIKTSNSVTIKWKKTGQSSIAGYRIYFSPGNEDYSILADTVLLKKNTENFVFEGPDKFNQYNFKICTVSKLGTESTHSDIYGVLLNSDINNKKILVVDGFNRRSSYTGFTHNFTADTYIKGLRDAGVLADISSCSNEAIISGQVDPLIYHSIIWFLGDESTSDETFSVAEQVKIKEYLNNGGKFFVTGSEIAWDLDFKGSVADKNFYHDYLKAVFLEDGLSGRSPATGIQPGDFSDLKLTYGVVYPEDYPDVLSPNGGSVIIFKYNQGSTAGVAYKGNFGGNFAIGSVVNLGFPLETVQDKEEISMFFKKLLKYFDILVTVEEPEEFEKNIFVYPTVFKERFNIVFQNLENEIAEIELFRIDGTCVLSEKFNYQESIELNPGNINDGIYLLKIVINGRTKFYKLIKR
ncbi:MAG: N-acetylmuramoyl-L-alanine amidase [Deltaproteobacteria bacterium]